MKNRIEKITNFLMLFFIVGSCLLGISIINTKSTYLEILGSSSKDGVDNYITMANTLFNTPACIALILTAVAIVMKELLLKPLKLRLKINAIGVATLFLLNLASVLIISYPSA